MFGLPKFGDGIGLHRIERFFEARGIDMSRLSQRSIVVTGSNGKGSTARFIAGALEGIGKRVGCFTSPHLFDVCERFLIGDTPIPRATFEAHAETVLAYNATLPEGDRMGAFEALFLIAILWFETEPLDAIVWEAGIGGRYDPTRTARATVSAITSIEREHTEILGATEELIAYDKSDALAPGGVLVLSPSIPASLADRISSYARLSRKTVARDEVRIRDVRNAPEGSSFRFRVGGDERSGQIRLIGNHQVHNALTALQAATAWRGLSTEPRRLVSHEADAMLAGIARVAWPGRLEKVAAAPDLWIDVGHTPCALDAVTRTFLEFVPRERTLVVFGVSGSKEVAAIARTVAARFDHFILTRAFKAGAEVDQFEAIFRAHAADVTIAPDTLAATQLARDRAARDGLTVLAVGGLFLAAEIQRAWEGGDPREIDFL
jgi:dihydrofolate synthase/folylpolyglutamate synthase